MVLGLCGLAFVKADSRHLLHASGSRNPDPRFTALLPMLVPVFYAVILCLERMEALLVGIRKFALSVVLMFWAVLLKWHGPVRTTQNEAAAWARFIWSHDCFPFLLVPGIIYLIRKNSDQDLPAQPTDDETLSLQSAY